MSAYSIASKSRLIWKTSGRFYTVQPDISSCRSDLRPSQALLTCSNFLSVIFKSCPSRSSRLYSSSSSSSGSGNGDDDKENSEIPEVSKSGEVDNSEFGDIKYNPKEDTFFTQDIAYGKKENRGEGNPERPYFDPPKAHEVEEELVTPTNCCRSGCPNCVWIDYVEKLTAKFTDPTLGRERILKDLDTIDDQSIKAFVMMELRSKGLI